MFHSGTKIGNIFPGVPLLFSFLCSSGCWFNSSMVLPWLYTLTSITIAARKIEVDTIFRPPIYPFRFSQLTMPFTRGNNFCTYEIIGLQETLLCFGSTPLPNK
jgi:hypothetical protein